MKSLWLGLAATLACAGQAGFAEDQDPRLLTERARLEQREGQYADAVVLYKRALAIQESTLGPDHPKVARTLSDLGNLYYRRAEYARAAPLLERALAIREQAFVPNHPLVAKSLSDLGLLYMTVGDYERAAPLLRRALAIRESVLGPEDLSVAAAYKNLALLYRAQGDEHRALMHFEGAAAIRDYHLAVKVNALGPNHPDVARELANLGSLYGQMGEFERAERLFKRAIEINPQNAQFYFSLGAQYESLGQTSKAIENYEAGLAIRSKQPLVKNNLAWLLVDVEDPSSESLDRALELARDARAEMPANPNIADTLGWVMFKRNEPDSAIELFQTALEGHPEGSVQRAGVRYRLARAYQKKGENVRAREEIERALEESPGFLERPDALDLLEQLSPASPAR